MTLSELRSMPEVINTIPVQSRGVHESMLKSYQVLQKAKDWLRQDVPGSVVLEMIDYAYERVS